MALRPGRSVTPWGRAFEGAFESGLSVVVGVVLGYYCDRWLGTEPVFLFVFMVLGGVAGVRRLLRIEWAGPAHRDDRSGRGPDEPGG